MEGGKGCSLILQITLNCTRAGLEFKMIFINWRGVKEVSAEINMDLSTENKHSMGKYLLGNSAAEEANGLRIISWNVSVNTKTSRICVTQPWKAVALNIPI